MWDKSLPSLYGGSEVKFEFPYLLCSRACRSAACRIQVFAGTGARVAPDRIEAGTDAKLRGACEAVYLRRRGSRVVGATGLPEAFKHGSQGKVRGWESRTQCHRSLPSPTPTQLLRPCRSSHDAAGRPQDSPGGRGHLGLTHPGGSGMSCMSDSTALPGCAARVIERHKSKQAHMFDSEATNPHRAS